MCAAGPTDSVQETFKHIALSKSVLIVKNMLLYRKSNQWFREQRWNVLSQREGKQRNEYDARKKIADMEDRDSKLCMVVVPWLYIFVKIHQAVYIFKKCILGVPVRLSQ